MHKGASPHSNRAGLHLGAADRPLRLFREEGRETTEDSKETTAGAAHTPNEDRGYHYEPPARLSHRPFDGFLEQAIFCAIIAVVFAWRLLVFTFKEDRRPRALLPSPIPATPRHREENNNLEAEAPSPDSPRSPVSDEMDPSIPSSLRGLLSTDSLPEAPSSSSDEDDFLMHPPPPHLLSIGALEIIEEESDENRSISSASFASPRTVLDAHPSRRSDYRSISSLSTISDYRSPLQQLSPREPREEEETGDELVEERREIEESGDRISEHTLSFSSPEKSSGKEEMAERRGDKEEEDMVATALAEAVRAAEEKAEECDASISIIERAPRAASPEELSYPMPPPPQLATDSPPTEEAPESPEGLLKGLAQLGSEPRKPGAISAVVASSPSLPALVTGAASIAAPISQATVPPVTVVSSTSTVKTMTSTAPGTRSILGEMMAETRHNDADRDQTEEIVFETTRPRPMEDAQSLDSVSIALNESRDSNLLDYSVTSNPSDETAIVERKMSSINRDPISGGAGSGGERPPYPPPSPPNDLPPPPPSLIGGGGGVRPSLSTSITSTALQTETATASAILSTAAPIVALDSGDSDIGERSMPRVSRYGYSGTAHSRIRTMSDERSDQGMSSPPPTAPPPPPLLSSHHAPTPVSVTSTSIPVYTTTVINPAGSTKSYSSREDLLGSESTGGGGGAPSRSTIREIPVHRAASAAPSTILDYQVHPPPSTHLSSYGAPIGRGATVAQDDMHDEYYRREVLTRTVITRSTEALSQPLRSSSPIERYITYPSDDTRETREVEYRVNRVRDVEEEERRITEERDRRRQLEEDRRQRDAELRRDLERLERETMDKLRREREMKERELESTRVERERGELDRIDRDRRDRELLEKARREEWERRENERRALEDADLDRRRAKERERFERERALEEQRERERLERERERLERERIEKERIEYERIERERIERERIERERLEIERIERIKREKIERERKDREREREEAERLIKEREELERLERERRELEIRQRELLVIAQKEAEQRERERREDEERERRRMADEAHEAALLIEIEREARERERLRKLQEEEERSRLDRLRQEQQQREWEKQEYDRRERERMEEERREKELLDAQKRKRDEREKERLDDERRERERLEEERRERDRRERERREALERERARQIEEAKERDRIAALEKSAAERRYQRDRELNRERELKELEARTLELKELEKQKAEQRAREREQELLDLEKMKRREAENRLIRDRERQEANERENNRRLEDRRSRDKLDMLIREKTEKEKMEEAKRALVAEKEWNDRRRNDPLSKENLERMTRKPYFSRENLSQPEVITKVERQVIERVDRNLWVDDRMIPTSYTQTSYAVEGPDDFGRTGRMFDRNSDLHRAGSARTSSRLLRSRMDQARRDFISGAPETSTDGFGDRLRKSTEDLSSRRPAPSYRGPLLEKFHEGEFSKSKADLEGIPYPHVGPSSYGQEFERLLAETERKYADYRSRSRSSQPNLYSRQRHYSSSYLETDVDTGRPELAQVVRQMDETNMDDVHRRSGSVLDHERSSRRDLVEQPGAVHSRSKSADYLMDRKAREESAVPENELQKQPRENSPRISEHELRFRKSTEKLDIPEWYRDQRTTGRATDLDATLSRPGQGYRQSAHEYSSRPTSIPVERPTSAHSTRYTQPFSYTAGPAQPPPSDSRSLLGNFDTRGMFDRYAGEIEEMRRSRSSLHQIGSPTNEDFRGSQPAAPQAPRQEQPIPVQRRSLSQEVISSRRETSSRTLPGYTVSEVPDTWEMITRNRRSRVIEVADTFVPKRSDSAVPTSRYGGRVTIEEVLDGIFQETRPADHGHPTEDPSLPQADHLYEGNHDGPSIYTHNYMLMDQVIKRPEQAEDLLKEENLFVRCSYCHRTRALTAARMQYVSCKHCYTYYCSRECRQNDWHKHSGRCSFARINTLCKDVIMKVRVDTEAQWWMSRVAREGFGKRGRGSVNIRLASPQLAQAYVDRGWSALAAYQPDHLLYYYTIAALVQERKDPSLVQLCKKYDPSDKFILSVSIIADVEHCPQTPPPETVEYTNGFRPQSVQLPPPSVNISTWHRPPPVMPTPIPVDIRTLVPTDV